MSLAPGQSISPNVRLSRMLGAGGMGSVWVAEHLTLRTEVAVKFIAAELATNEEALHRFSREAISAARIKNPHVVQVLDHGVYEGRPYIVMELLAGEDLSDRLERSGALPVAEAAHILRQACKALAAAHALGIVHRDIKPANFFLTWSADDLFVKLLDFGIAKQVGGGQPTFTTATNTVVGTPFYMSPEQVFAQDTVDFRSDLWSMAVVAYEMITGVLPFQGDSLGNLYVALHKGVFRPPSQLPHVPFPALDPWFARALSQDPAGRFASARELGETFAAIARKCGRDYVPEPPERDDFRTIRRPEGLADVIQEAEARAVARAGSQPDDPSTFDAAATPAFLASPEPPTHDTLRSHDIPSPPLARAAARVAGRSRLVTAGVAAAVLAVGLGAVFLLHGSGAQPPADAALSAADTAAGHGPSGDPTLAATAVTAEPAPGGAADPAARSSTGALPGAPPVVVAGTALGAAPTASVPNLPIHGSATAPRPGASASVASPGSSSSSSPSPSPSAPKRHDHGF